jgi:hypothetical protein
MRNVSDKSCREKPNTFFPLENHAFCEITWKKYCRTRQTTDDNMAHALCMLDA